MPARHCRAVVLEAACLREAQPPAGEAHGECGAVNCAVVDHCAVEEGDEAAEDEGDVVYHPLV